MNRSIQILLILCTLGLVVTLSAHGVDKPPKEPWKGKFADGTEITEGELQIILEKHQKWLRSGKQEGERADLSGSVKDGMIVIQGDHRDTVKGFLEGKGFGVKIAGG